MKNEIKVTISKSGEVEVDMTKVGGSVEEVKKILEDLTEQLGPITAERHVPGKHHHHEGLQEKVTGG